MMQVWFDVCAMLGLMIELLQSNLGVKLNSMREFLQNRRLKWLGYLEKEKKESAWFSIYSALKLSSSFSREWPRKSWNEVIKSDLKKRELNKNLARQKCLEVFNWKPSNTCKHGKKQLGFFFLFNLDSLQQAWTATTRHGVTRKRSTKRLQPTENLFRKNLHLKDVC